MNSRVFDWDVWKAATNLDKHGVSFEEAMTVFLDEESLLRKDHMHSSREVRWHRLGMSIDLRILSLVYTLRRTASGEEKIRIITARKASRRERQDYSRPRD